MHWIQALVAPKYVLENAGTAHPAAVVRLLPQNFCLVPITAAFAASLQESGRLASDPAVMPANEMPPGVCAFAAQASHRGPVIFVATHIHGGTGGQHALVWERGEITLSLHEDEDTMSAWPNSSISRALRHVGVVARPKEDEFDALGLGTHRSTDKWAQSVEEIFPAAILERDVPESISLLDKKKTWWRFW
jgi:hypothetical protein